MNFLIETREWIAFFVEIAILVVIIMEYQYDKSKDDAKKRKHTRTTKKTTVTPSGETVTEESTESVESKGEKNG